MYQQPFDVPAHSAFGSYRGPFHRLHDTNGETVNVTHVFVNRSSNIMVFSGALIDWARTDQAASGFIFPQLRHGVTIVIAKATAPAVRGLVFGLGHEMLPENRRLYRWQANLRIICSRYASIDIGIGHPALDAVVANDNLEGLPPLKPWNRDIAGANENTVGRQSNGYFTYLTPSTFLPARHDHYLPPNIGSVPVREHIVSGEGIVHVREPDFTSAQTGSALFCSISNPNSAGAANVYDIFGTMFYMPITSPDASVITEVL